MIRPLAGSAHRDEVAEDSIGGLQRSDDRASQLILASEMATEETLRLAALLELDADDDHVRVERAHRFHSDQLELEFLLRECLDRAKGGIGGESKIAIGTRDALDLSDNAFVLEPLEFHFCGTAPGRRTREGKARKAQPLPSELRLSDDWLRQRIGLGHVGIQEGFPAGRAHAPR